jgi:proline iminopeptidase
MPGQAASPRYQDPDFRLCSARLVTHYWSHGHFMDDEALARDVERLAGIPGVLIRGAFDFAPPLDLFWRLARGWPEGELVVIAEEGHRGGGATDVALVRATDRLGRS